MGEDNDDVDKTEIRLTAGAVGFVLALTLCFPAAVLVWWWRRKRKKYFPPSDAIAPKKNLPVGAQGRP